MHKYINVDYDKQYLLELYQKSKKIVSKNIFIDATIPEIAQDPEISALFDKFSFIPPVYHSVALTMLTKEMKPYINPGCNGLIILPIQASLELSFYSYPGEIIDGRPTLNPTYDRSLVPTIQETLTETVITDRPIMINGLVTHSYKPNPADLPELPLMLIFKIPSNFTWDEATSFVE